jgi:parallel beta-helix repeat protein
MHIYYEIPKGAMTVAEAETDHSGTFSNNIASDPKFIDAANADFHLQSNSLCIDAGVDVGLSLDFEGNPVPQGNAPDIGAYEYAGGAICEPNTYYVDATNGDDGNDGRCTDTAWKTIDKVNRMSFSPGYYILFKRGETWRERLAPSSSGSAGNPITFGAYGSGDKPIINGADPVTPWTDDGSNVWYADLTSEPRQVFFDNVRGNNQTSKADVDSDKDWFWESNTLYVYSVGNPDTVYTNPGMEVSDSSRGQCISIHAKSYIDIRDLDLRNAHTHCLDMYNSDNINVYDNDISNSGKRGIYTATSSYMDIYRNTFEWCGVELVTPEHGIYLGTNSSHVDVYENEVSYSWNSGIKCDSVSDVKVYRNYVHDNNQEYSYFGEIHIGSSAADLSNLEIYYNLIEIGDGYGIHSGYLYGHTKTNVSIYNNVIWDNNAGPAPKNYALRLENIDTLNIKNNAIKTAREYVMRYNNNSNVIRDYNCYYGWTHATRMGTIDGSWVTWSDVSSVETHSINQDPLFVDAPNIDFHLQGNSPCIDAGTDVGLTLDFEGNPVPQGNFPDIGAYEYAGGPIACYQDSDCGAGLCKTYTCNNPGTPSAYCSSQKITSCINDDGCCPPGCTEQNDNDCSGLVGLYHFDEGSGTFASDSSGYGNDGTVYGATWTTGISGKALEFDGVDDYINHGDVADLNVETISISIWIKPGAQDADNIFLSKGGYQVDGWYLWHTSDNDIQLRVNSATSHEIESASSFFTFNEWQHVAVVFNKSKVYWHKNGIPFTSDPDDDISMDWALPIGKNLTIGDYSIYHDTYNFNGSIDEVRIYNRTLTPEEILNLYNEVAEHIKADLNNDGAIDIYDLAIITTLFGQTQSHPEWEETADVISNGEIDIYDVVFVASRFT